MFDIISCPSCQRQLRLPETHRGSEVKCPACGTSFRADNPPAEEDIPYLQPAPADESEPSRQDDFPERLRPNLPPKRPPMSPRYRKKDTTGWREQAPRHRGLQIVGLLVGIIVVIAGIGVLVWQPWKDRGPKRVPLVENPQERRQQIRGAFRDNKPLAHDELARELQVFFADLGRAFQSQNADQMIALFDVERMVDELAATQPLPPDLVRNKSGFLRGMRAGMGNSLAKRASLMQWVRFQVRHIKRLGNAEVVVIVRHQQADGTAMKMRWWLIRGGGQWRVFDMEDLDVGLRSTTSMGSLIGLGPKRGPEVAAATNTVVEALMLLVQHQDADGAERKLQEASRVILPPKLDSLRYLLKALIHLQRGRFADSLTALDEATRRNPDMPMADFLRGLAFNKLGKWDQALKHLEAYRDLLGDEAGVSRELGLALRGVRRFEEAAISYRKALDEAPKDADAFLGLLMSLNVDDPIDDIGGRFAKLDELRANFDICAKKSWTNRNSRVVEHLARAMRKIDPAYAPVDHYLSLVQAQAGQAVPARALHRAAMTREQDPKLREQYTRQFLEAMVDGGKVVEAYAAATDAQTAFRILASRLKQRYVVDGMKQLLAVHARKHADDPLLLLYQGEQYVQQQQYKLADEAFGAAAGKPLDPATLHSFRPSRVLARYHLGQALSAYTTIGPRSETFTQLAWLCLGRKDYAGLQALLDAHARKEPGSKEVVEHRLRLHVRQQQSAEASALLKEALGKRNKQAADALVAVFLSEMVSAGKRLEGYNAAPDKRQAFRLLMDNYRGTAGRKKERRELLAIHRQRHADDPWVLYWTGVFQAEDRAWPAAAATFTKLWKSAGKDLRRRMRWSYAQALSQTGQSLRAYRDSGADKDVYATLVGILCADRKGAELEALVQAHRPTAPDDPQLLFHAARAKVFLKQPAEAVILFQQAYQRQPWGNQRQTCVTTFVRDMAGIDRGLDAYRAAADKPLTFRTLAQTLVFKKNAAKLAKLLDEHGKAHAGTPLALFYQGELYLLHGEAARAELSFRTALKGARTQDRWMFRNGLFRASVKAGKVTVTYEELGRDVSTFETLANMCVAAKDARQLAALIAAHRKAHPKDANLLSRELDVKWLNKDYDGVLKLLADDPGGVLGQRFRWKVNNYRIRCLVRLKRTQEAWHEAEALRKKNAGSDLLLLLAKAAQGDVKQTLALMRTLSPRPELLSGCYTDEDLGPIIKSEAFRAFRDQFPESKDQGQRFPADDEDDD